jgi:predicted transcriptional regulator
MNGLGELEAAVMDVLWRATQHLRVRAVLNELAPQRTLAYTTVMTVLDNLHRKGRVVRQLDGKAYLYQPTSSRQETATQAMRELIEATGDPDSVLLHFARTASKRELAVLRKAIADRTAKR